MDRHFSKAFDLTRHQIQPDRGLIKLSILLNANTCSSDDQEEYNHIQM